jgi:hypothetical protein
MFPIVEVIHMIGIVLLVGTAVILDLRLMGLRLKSVPVWELASDLMPRAFAASGVLGTVQTANASEVARIPCRRWKRHRIVLSDATRLYRNWAFLVKAAQLLLVAVNGSRRRYRGDARGGRGVQCHHCTRRKVMIDVQSIGTEPVYLKM